MIYDCFMYFDEDMILDLRMNILSNHVDYFVIVESKYTHQGNIKGKNFDITKFKRFEDKIIYLYDENNFHYDDKYNMHGFCFSNFTNINPKSY